MKQGYQVRTEGSGWIWCDNMLEVQNAVEPINVQVARALGWCLFLGTSHGVPPEAQYKHYHRPIPDYLHDKAWLWDVVVGNALDICQTIHGEWMADNGAVRTFAPSPEEAVCRWRIAAKAAGIEVRT